MTACGLFFVAGFGVMIYGGFFEPYIIETKDIKLNLNKTPQTEQIRIVQISDLHAGPFKGQSFFQDVAQKILDLKPDLVVMTGDYIYNQDKQAQALEALKPLTQQITTYAITGNHEFGQSSYLKKIEDKTSTMKQAFRDIGVILLDNQTQVITINNQRFLLVGLQDVWSNQKTEEILTDANSTYPQLPKILLCHNPEVILEPASAKFDLILSGHTHGGQIRLPGIGSLVSLPTSIDNHFDHGLFELSDTQKLYISNGIGESGPRARLFSRPEINLFTIDL